MKVEPSWQDDYEALLDASADSDSDTREQLEYMTQLAAAFVPRNLISGAKIALREQMVAAFLFERGIVR